MKDSRRYPTEGRRSSVRRSEEELGAEWGSDNGAAIRLFAGERNLLGLP